MAGRLLVLGSLAVNAVLAFPKPEPATFCEQHGECEWFEMGGYRVQRLVNGTSTALARREGVATNIDIGTGQLAVENPTGQHDGDQPAYLEELWGRATEACLATSCNPQQAIEVGGYRLEATGQFQSTWERDNFFELLRETYHQTLQRERREETINNPGNPPTQHTLFIERQVTSNFYNVNRFGGENSGQSLAVLLTRIEDNGGCPGWLDGASGFLSLAPHIGTFFGFISAACAL